jgi:hypothetical protein
MSIKKKMINTPRYETVEHLINKEVKCVANYQKYGTIKGSNAKTVCLTNLKINNLEFIDHTWIQFSKAFIKKRLAQGQEIELILRPKKRIRPGETIRERLVDVSFELISII